MAVSNVGPVVMSAEMGPSLRVVGDIVRLKVSGSDTGGAFALIEEISPPGNGTPLHVHSREDELFYVLEGTLEFRCGDQVHQATPGFTVFGPRNIPHNFRNIGDTPSRILVFIYPAGFEQFFVELDGISQSGTPELPRLMDLGEKYGLKILV